MPAMKRELFNKWTAALRGGEYKQTQGRLYNSRENAFCCLGVLCEVHDDVTRIVHPINGEEGYLYHDAFYPGSLIPRVGMSMAQDNAPRGLNFRQELGLDASCEGSMMTIHGQLMEYNDSRGYNFAQIADVLDEYVAEGVLKLVD